MKRQNLIFLVVVIIITAVAIFFIRKDTHFSTISLTAVSTTTPTTPIAAVTPLDSVIVARSDADREHGLSGKDSLAANTGMLFVFDHDDRYGFWMKDMKFPIDIIWLDSNLQIVHVENGLKPETYPKIFYPDENSRFVLEVNAGIAQKNNYSKRQMLDFLKTYIYMK